MSPSTNAARVQTIPSADQNWLTVLSFKMVSFQEPIHIKLTADLSDSIQLVRLEKVSFEATGLPCGLRNTINFLPIQLKESQK